MEGTTKRIKWLLFVKSPSLYHEINNEAGSQKAWASFTNDTLKELPMPLTEIKIDPQTPSTFPHMNQLFTLNTNLTIKPRFSRLPHKIQNLESGVFLVASKLENPFRSGATNTWSLGWSKDKVKDRYEYAPWKVVPLCKQWKPRSKTSLSRCTFINFIMIK